VLESKYNIDISIKDAKKVGDGMNAYMAYRVITKVWKSNISGISNYVVLYFVV